MRHYKADPIPNLMWAAGFLDGEGSFSSGKGSPIVQGHQVSIEPLIELQRLFGGSIACYSRPNNPKAQPIHVWTVCGSRAAGVMMTLFTLLTERRQEQIKNVLVKWRALKGRPKTKQDAIRGSLT